MIQWGIPFFDAACCFRKTAYPHVAESSHTGRLACQQRSWLGLYQHTLMEPQSFIEFGQGETGVRTY